MNCTLWTIVAGAPPAVEYSDSVQSFAACAFWIAIAATSLPFGLISALLAGPRSIGEAPPMPETQT